MTDEDKAQQYGKAMLDLRQAKFDLAAAQKKLSTAIESLQEVTAAVQHFAANPLARTPDGRPVADLGYAWHGALGQVNLPELAHEVFSAARRVVKLQAEVDAFEK